MNAFVLTVVALLSIPSWVVLVQCLCAVVGRRYRRDLGAVNPEDSDVGSIAVVLPAHNEEPIIGTTVRHLLPELRPHDRLIVVADNCSDKTAEEAELAGADVLRRKHDRLRGKGFALQYAISELASDPPDVIVFLDADCHIESGGLLEVAACANIHQRPVQAAYLMYPQSGASTATRISAFGVSFRNVVRPSGMQCLGLPCLLTGSGMAFPWAVLQEVDHPGGHIVEDMSYSIELALAGVAPRPKMSVQVSSVLPEEASAAKSQRVRWEHGHLDTIFSQVPRLLRAFLRTGRIGLLAMLLDLIVPPLSLFVMVGIGVLAVTLGWGLVTQWWLPMYLAIAAFVSLTFSLVLAWATVGRELISMRHILGIPGYMLYKVPIYLRFLWMPQKEWVRTDRSEQMQQELHLAHQLKNDTTERPSRSRASS